MSNTYIKLIEGSMLKNRLRWKNEDEAVTAPNYSKDYKSILVGVSSQHEDNESEGMILPANKYVEIISDCSIDPNTYYVEMEHNPALNDKVRSLHYSRLIIPETGAVVPTLYVRTKESIDLSALDYLLSMRLIG